MYLNNGFADSKEAAFNNQAHASDLASRYPEPPPSPGPGWVEAPIWWSRGMGVR